MRIAAFFLLLCCSAGAQAAAAWDIADKWRCDIKSTAVCAPGQPCSDEQIEMMQDIDFEEGAVWLVGIGSPHERFIQSPLTARDFDGGGSYFSTGRQLFLMRPTKKSSRISPQYSLQIASLSVTGASSIMFGYCKPI